jgi:hypothetical protein
MIWVYKEGYPSAVLGSYRQGSPRNCGRLAGWVWTWEPGECLHNTSRMDFNSPSSVWLYWVPHEAVYAARRKELQQKSSREIRKWDVRDRDWLQGMGASALKSMSDEITEAAGPMS